MPIRLCLTCGRRDRMKKSRFGDTCQDCQIKRASTIRSLTQSIARYESKLKICKEKLKEILNDK